MDAWRRGPTNNGTRVARRYSCTLIVTLYRPFQQIFFFARLDRDVNEYEYLKYYQNSNWNGACLTKAR